MEKRLTQDAARSVFERIGSQTVTSMSHTIEIISSIKASHG